jgi:hypothetical protein
LIVAFEPAGAHEAVEGDAISVFCAAKAVFIVDCIVPEMLKLACITAVFILEAVF